MKKRIILSQQQGATAVEFALILSLLIACIFGILELGLFLFNKQVITNASREGARYGIVSRASRFVDGVDIIDIEAEVRKYAEKNLVTFGENNLDIEVWCAYDFNPEDGEPDDPDGNPDTPPCDPSEPGKPGCCDPYTESNCCVEFRCPLTVRVTFDYNFLFLSNFGLGPKHIVANTVMELE